MQRGRRPIRILLEKRLRHRAVAAAAAALLYLLWALLLDGGDPVKEPVADVAAEPAVGAYVHGDGPHAVGDLVVDVQDQIVVRSGSNDVLQERLTPRGQQAVLAADDVVFVRDEPCQLGGSLGNVHVQDVVGESGGYQGSPLDFEPERLELVRLAAGRLPFVVVQRHVVQMVAVLGRHAEILVSERAPLRTPHVNLHGPAAVLVEHGRDPLVVRIGESVLVTDHGHRIIVEAHYIVEKGLHLALHLVHPDDAQPGKGLIHVGVLAPSGTACAAVPAGQTAGLGVWTGRRRPGCPNLARTPGYPARSAQKS